MGLHRLSVHWVSARVSPTVADDCHFHATVNHLKPMVSKALVCTRCTVWVVLYSVYTLYVCGLWSSCRPLQKHVWPPVSVAMDFVMTCTAAVVLESFIAVVQETLHGNGSEQGGTGSKPRSCKFIADVWEISAKGEVLNSYWSHC